MYQTIKNANYELKDATDFVKKIGAETFEFFDRTGEIFITRSPGRLDVMGGIADYSGSHVLEMPIAEATFCALQKRADNILKIFSEDETENLFFEMPFDKFYENGEPIEYSSAHDFFRVDFDEHWAAYIAGVFHVLMREKNFKFQAGANIFISSKVPQGKGVSSSAALESSVMSAVAATFEIKIEPREMAILCQKVENLVVGAPCGIMDQMSVVCGKQNELLSLLCRPAKLENPVKIPDEICFWGIDSGIRHSVVGADYGSVRTGAFMGLRIVNELQKDDAEINYLASISPADFENNYRNKIPLEMSGAAFLEKYGGIADKITTVLPDKTYAVFYPTAHPVYENARVKKFAELLGEEMNEANLTKLGKLMFAAHESYSACGLGSVETDLLVKLVKEIGVGKGLYGAKITGGGSGGTVAVLGLKDAGDAIEKVAEEYEKQTNYQPYIFNGSSSGAANFGFLKIIKE